MVSIHAKLSEIEDNIRYIEKELPCLKVSAEIKASVLVTLDDIAIAIRDARSWARKFEVHIAGATDGSSAEAVTTFIRDRLMNGLRPTQELVEELQQLSDAHSMSDYTGLSILVKESCANMLNAFTRLCDLLDTAPSQAAGHAAKPVESDWSGDVHEHRFECEICGREAGLVQLVATPTGSNIQRNSFTGSLHLPILNEAVDMIRAAIAAGDAHALYKFDLEVASFYCPSCGKCYCGKHWARWDVFENDDGYVHHDCIRGRCPAGHERMLED